MDKSFLFVLNILQNKISRTLYMAYSRIRRHVWFEQLRNGPTFFVFMDLRAIGNLNRKAKLIINKKD